MRYGFAQGERGSVGIPAPHGRLVALEVKTPTGRAAPEQEAVVELVAHGFCMRRAQRRGSRATRRIGAAWRRSDQADVVDARTEAAGVPGASSRDDLGAVVVQTSRTWL